jgi:hypothetical protein
MQAGGPPFVLEIFAVKKGLHENDLNINGLIELLVFSILFFNLGSQAKSRSQ